MKALFYIVSLLFCLVSCTEVMDDFEVGSAEAKIVVEATISPTQAQVILSKTTAYLNPTSIPYISGSHITIAYDDTIVTLHEDSVGYYSLEQQFESQKMYSLSITIGDNFITAESYMPSCVRWDSCSVKLSEYNSWYEFPDSLGKIYEVLAYVTDPVESANYYRKEVYKNDTIYSKETTDDSYFNGQTVQLETLMGFFKEDDIVKIYLKSIDKQAFEYYNTLALSNSSSGMFAAPDNPKSNLQGDALGRFYAYTVDSVIVRFE